MFKSTDRRLLTIVMIVLVQMVGASLVLPILPLYAKRQFAMEPQVITLLISSFFAAQFVAGPYIGRLSDRYGRLPVLIISQIGTIIGFAMLGAAQSVPILFFARILDGITGGNIIVARAYVTDITPREERTTALGYIAAAFGVGFILGPALGGISAAMFGERMPFYIAAAAAALTVLMTWFTLDETITPEQQQQNRTQTGPELGFTQIVGNLPLILVLLLTFAANFGLGLLSSTFALFGEDVLFAGQSEDVTSLGIGLLLMLVGVGQLGTQVYLLKRMLKRFSESVIVIIGSLLRSLAMLTLALTVSPWLAAVGTLLFSIGGGLIQPSLQSLATDTVSDQYRGAVMGVYQSAFGFANILSTALAGWLYAIQPTVPYWLAAVLFLLALVPGLLLKRMLQPEPTISGTIEL